MHNNQSAFMRKAKSQIKSNSMVTFYFEKNDETIMEKEG